MSRKSQRFLWKHGDGEGKKEDLQPKLYDEPPHELVDGDEATYPPKYVELSSMWVFQIVRCPFISQEVRYQRWPIVFPSKDPLRATWSNKGLAPKVWSDVRQVWVYPVVFGKYQLHGKEGTGHFDIDQSDFIDSVGTNATHDIREGATCVVQEPSSLSSNAAVVINVSPPTDEGTQPKHRKINTGRKSKVPVFPKGVSKEPKAAEQDEETDPELPKNPKTTGPKRGAKRPKTTGTEATGPETETNQGLPKDPKADEPKKDAKRPKTTGTKATEAEAETEQHLPRDPKSDGPKKDARRPNATGATAAEPKAENKKRQQATDTEPETPSKRAKPSTPANKPKPTRLIDSASGGKRFALDEDADDDVETPNFVTYKDLQQAQGKVVLLATALHNTWTLLGAYNERMVKWSTVCRVWKKHSPEDIIEFQELMTELSDNRELNNALLMKANAVFNEISEAFPAMDRITRDDYEDWRSAIPEGFEKLGEEGDKEVDAYGELVEE